MNKQLIITATTLLMASSLVVAAPGGGKGGGKKGGDSTTEQPNYYNWMHSDVKQAWADGYTGAGTTITVVDDFTSNWGYYGNLTGTEQLLRHGEWTYTQASLIAPDANMRADDFNDGNTVRLARRSFNILNLSYGMFAQTGWDVNNINWSNQEQSIINYATDGRAVIAKAAGNDAVAVGTATADGYEDYLATALIGTQSTLFVGALDGNGSTTDQASMAWYSNTAGTNTTVQSQYLVVGVEGDQTGLYGTSFAAPIISGYSAILHSKFTKASPTQVAQQLLDTARIDTVANYDASIYGQGEASLSRALAPVAIQ